MFIFGCIYPKSIMILTIRRKLSFMMIMAMEVVTEVVMEVVMGVVMGVVTEVEAS